MKTNEIKKNLAQLLNVNTSELSVKVMKVSYRNYSQVVVQSRTINLWEVETKVQRMYPSYSASSAVYATI